MERGIDSSNHGEETNFSQITFKHVYTFITNEAGYTATLVSWVGAVLEKITWVSGQEPYAQKAKKRRKSEKSQKH